MRRSYMTNRKRDGAKGQPKCAKSRRVAVRECQSPAIEAPRTAPHPASHAPTRIPAPKSRSTVIVSTVPVSAAKIIQDVSSVPVARATQNRTTSNPGPFPMFEPATQQVEPRVNPAAAKLALAFLLSATSSRTLTPSTASAPCVTTTTTKEKKKYGTSSSTSSRTSTEDFVRSTVKSAMAHAVITVNQAIANFLLL